MKHFRSIFWLWVCMILPASSFAQTDSLLMWADRADDFATRYPQETVFVHMDNSSYFLGDTIYFKAYVERSDLRTPSNISNVLYAELLNHDGYLVERQLIELKDGQGFGSFCLPDTVYAGYYELRAYTRWQLNWGVSQRPYSRRVNSWFLRNEFASEFYRDYDKLYSRVFPVYDKPRKAGNYERMMTLRPLQRDYGDLDEGVNVQFYPEGGSWVAGTRQRMAFEATDPEGKHLVGEVVLENGRHDTLAVVPTGRFGRGLLTVLPEWGGDLNASLRWGDGRRKKLSLPKAVKQGVSMEVQQEATHIRLDIDVRGMEPSGLALVVMEQGRKRFYSPLEGRQMRVPLDSLDSGVCDFTIFDGNGRVWASRLAFVWKDDLKTQNVSFEGVPARCDSLQKVRIRIKSAREGTLSLAVRDKDTSEPVYDNGNILTEMLLGSELKGFVEDPGYYFESRDSARLSALDLLMMVQGWRRYEWKSLTGDFRTLQPFEKTPLLMGEVYKYSPLDQEDTFITEILEQYILDDIRGGVGPIIAEKIVVDYRENIGFDDAGSALGRISHGPDYVSHGEENTDNSEEHTSSGNMNIGGEQNGAKTGQLPGVYNSEEHTPLRQSLSLLSDSVFVRAQFSRGKKFLLESECWTKKRFLLPMPVTYGPYNLNLGAYHRKQKKIKEGKNRYQGEYPDYSVRVVEFYPRWPHPYSYYQSHAVERAEEGREVGPEQEPVRLGDVQDMRELTVRQRIRGRRAIDYSKPAYVTDAYRLFNETVDAGLLTAYFSGYRSFALQSTRLLFGNMETGRGYHLKRRWNGKTTSLFPETEQQDYNHLKNLYRVVFYTDFSLRLRGDKRYFASNQPEVLYNLERLEPGTMRPAFKSRYFQMEGFSTCEEFYNPDYSKRALPEGQKDTRRTLYWNPNLQLDAQGEAQIEFYAPGKETYLFLEANGQQADGTLLTGKKE